MDILPASASNEDNDILHSDRKRVGRPSFHKMFPDLVPCVENYIQQNTASAHLRRRYSTMYLNGVTLNDITRHVKKELGIEVSRHTIHRLLRPKRTGTTTSKRFKSLINARVPPKNNSGEKRLHPHFHYTCAQINIVNEMATLCQKGTLRMSVDNKNKVDVGTTAVSRRCQIRTFCLQQDAPTYFDHDFPYRNSKLTPAGYQILTPQIKRSRSISPPATKKQVRQ